MNRPHFRRHPRPVDPEPDCDWLDWQGVGLPGRMTAPCPVCGAPDHVGWKGSLPTRYDAEWPDVRAAEAGGWAGGDLAAMAAPKWADLYGIDPEFPGGDLAAMAAPGDWPVWDYGEGYEIEAEERAVQCAVWGESTRAIANRIRARRAAEPVKPRGRHRQTDPADLILADLRDLGGLA